MRATDCARACAARSVAMRVAITSLALVAPVVAYAQAPAADTVVMPGIEIVLRPERNKAGDVAAVLVTFHLTDTVLVAPMVEFRAPIVLNNIPGIADRIRGFRIDDGRGPVLLTRTDDSADASGFGYNRRWRTARSVSFPVTVRYSAIVPPGRLRAGPPFDLRTFAGGVSGGGAGFLALPQDARQYRVRIRWDLRALRRGWVHRQRSTFAPTWRGRPRPTRRSARSSGTRSYARTDSSCASFRSPPRRGARQGTALSCCRFPLGVRPRHPAAKALDSGALSPTR